MTTPGLDVIVRQMTEEDLPGVVEVQKRAFPGMPIWTAPSLARHLLIFPEGQLVAVDRSGRILGSASSLIIDWDDYADHAKWAAITGHGSFDTHNPLGKTLYGADIGVDPEARGLGIGSMFYDARKKLIRERGLKRLLTGGRIPGYAEVAQRLTPKEYVGEVVAGRRHDPTLSFQLKNGLVVLDVVPDYLQDTESRGFATLLEWLNPAYQTSISMELGEGRVPAAQAEAPASVPRQTRRVRIAAIQYDVRPIRSFEEFAAQAEFFIHGAHEYRSHFVLFPEYFSMQLLSYFREPAAGRAVRLLAGLTPRYEALFRRLATQSGIYIIAGTFPVIEQGELFNAAHLFTPSGLIFRQKKVHLTPTERGPYQMSRGHGFYVFHTRFGRIAILVCYDVEFPEAAPVLAKGGTEILFVPSCTDDRQGYCRVRYCAQSRAIENQIYVVTTGTVGNLPQVPHMAINYGQAAILTPSDYHFARDGLAAEGTLNQEQMIVADVDLELLEEQRVKGTVIPLNDLIKDAYDRVMHFTDRPEGLLLESDADLRELLALELQSVGVDTVLAAGSVQEMQVAGTDLAALACAVLDVNLGTNCPSGIDAARWLRRNGFRGNILFLAEPQAGAPDMARVCEDLHAQVIEKPASFDGLAVAIQESFKAPPLPGAGRPMTPTARPP